MKGWNDALNKKPRTDRFFELCFLDLGHKVIKGWYTGAGWDGYKYKGENVKRWKYAGGFDE